MNSCWARVMKELHDVASALLDVDGFCRDLNFERPTWAGVGALTGRLQESFKEISATDLQGHEIADVSPESVSYAARDSGSVRLLFGGGTGLIRHLQLFIVREAGGSPFVELTFFPDDVRPAEDLRTEFLSWANDLRACLRARRYYARYENASWRFGDIGDGSGVFLVSDPVAPDA